MRTLLRQARQGLVGVALGLVGLASTVQAALPPTQRQALVDLYNAANGAGWTNNSNWLTGDPCTNGWFGVACDMGETTVVRIDLADNQLSGSLSGLDALPDLEFFNVRGNQLGGSIPPLAGLPLLSFFNVAANQLTGPLPDLGNLSNLYQFEAYDNQLSGPIPPLAGLSSLVTFNVHTNQLTGPIPPLAGIAGLSYFTVDGNQLSGPLPDLAGLANLGVFNASDNQLTGSIPPLSGLVGLNYFAVSYNRLTGPLPSLAGLNALQAILVSNNQLSGPVPVAPAPLVANSSSLCPNLFTPATGSANDLAWNAATGRNPWSSACARPVVPVPTLHAAALAGLAWMLAGIVALRLRRSGPR